MSRFCFVVILASVCLSGALAGVQEGCEGDYNFKYGSNCYRLTTATNKVSIKCFESAN